MTRLRLFCHVLASLLAVFAEACGDASPTPAPSSPAAVAVASVEMDTKDAIGGQPIRGTVTLAAAAPSNGAIVTLRSSDSATASIPSSLSIAAGEMKGTFTVMTTAVTRDVVVTVSATTSGTPVSTAFTVVARGRSRVSRSLQRAPPAEKWSRGSCR